MQKNEQNRTKACIHTDRKSDASKTCQDWFHSNRFNRSIHRRDNDDDDDDGIDYDIDADNHDDIEVIVFV
ncbi:hypothetical protein CHS0354_035966 [Potamilus streckersoni]|uniref:Uncharacterized protein n=1 Tax=Potamilus streckersoni TaxID=2493646 RepID=A0AAE0TGS2_9BIVA|nr:hypothetical protein CHS0354_035966 [Potamilus streckersoni]